MRWRCRRGGRLRWCCEAQPLSLFARSPRLWAAALWQAGCTQPALRRWPRAPRGRYPCPQTAARLRGGQVVPAAAAQLLLRLLLLLLLGRRGVAAAHLRLAGAQGGREVAVDCPAGASRGTPRLLAWRAGPRDGPMALPAL
jgi:hypothetical protein